MNEGQYRNKKTDPKSLFDITLINRLQVHQTREETLKTMNKLFSDASCRVIFNNPVDPFDVLPHFGVDAGVVWVCAADAPGHNAL